MEISIDKIRRLLEKMDDSYRNVAEKKAEVEMLHQQLLALPEDLEEARRFEGLRMMVCYSYNITKRNY